jgi:hypothetical protein
MSFQSLFKGLVVRMEVTPAWFPISSQRIGGEPVTLSERGLQNLSFFV